MHCWYQNPTLRCFFVAQSLGNTCCTCNRRASWDITCNCDFPKCALARAFSVVWFRVISAMNCNTRVQLRSTRLCQNMAFMNRTLRTFSRLDRAFISAAVRCLSNMEHASCAFLKRTSCCDRASHSPDRISRPSHINALAVLCVPCTEHFVRPTC